MRSFGGKSHAPDETIEKWWNLIEYRWNALRWMCYFFQMKQAVLLGRLLVLSVAVIGATPFIGPTFRSGWTHLELEKVQRNGTEDLSVPAQLRDGSPGYMKKNQKK
jgi:hypothetical protein